MTDIELNVPIPKRAGGFKHKTGGVPQILRDLAQAPIGASVLITEANSRAVSGYVSAATCQTGSKFSIRAVDGGTRVWRIA